MVEKNLPLILVIYLNKEVISNKEYMDLYGSSINEYIESKGYNILIFFLPTDDNERIECINPIIINEGEYSKVETLINDIRNKFQIDESN